MPLRLAIRLLIAEYNKYCVTSPDGTINSTCFTNHSGGFSVVRYTGDGNNNATVAHNLSGEVDFMIVAKFDAGRNHLTYWRQEGNESVLLI